jgi:hypothetical protein
LSFIELVVLLSNGIVFKSSLISEKEKSEYGYVVISFICVIILIAVFRVFYDNLYPILKNNFQKRSHAKKSDSLGKDRDRIRVQSSAVEDIGVGITRPERASVILK